METLKKGIILVATLSKHSGGYREGQFLVEQKAKPAHVVIFQTYITLFQD